MRAQETDINKNNLLIEPDQTDDMFLAGDKEFYETLKNLNSKETVFNGEHGES